MIKLRKTEPKDHKTLWQIALSHPQLYDDSVNIKDYKEFLKLLDDIDDSLVAVAGDEVVGFFYLDNFKEQFANINIITKRHSIPPSLTPELLKTALQYFFQKHTVLDMIGAVIHADNIACLTLVDKVGGLITGYMEDHLIVKGTPMDCMHASVLREVVCG